MLTPAIIFVKDNNATKAFTLTNPINIKTFKKYHPDRPTTVLDLTGKELISKFIDGYGCHHKSRVIRELWLVASKYYESNHKTINRMYLAWIYPDSIETTPID